MRVLLNQEEFEAAWSELTTPPAVISNEVVWGELVNNAARDATFTPWRPKKMPYRQSFKTFIQGRYFYSYIPPASQMAGYLKGLGIDLVKSGYIIPTHVFVAALEGINKFALSEHAFPDDFSVVIHHLNFNSLDNRSVGLTALYNKRHKEVHRIVVSLTTRSGPTVIMKFGPTLTWVNS